MSLCFNNVNYKIRIVFTFVLIQIWKLLHKDVIFQGVFSVVLNLSIYIYLYFVFSPNILTLSIPDIVSPCVEVLGTILVHES